MVVASGIYYSKYIAYCLNVQLKVSCRLTEAFVQTAEMSLVKILYAKTAKQKWLQYVSVNEMM